MPRQKIRKSDWLPALILIYFVIIMCFYGPDLLARGEYLRFSLITVLELVIILLLRMVLRRRENIKKE